MTSEVFIEEEGGHTKKLKHIRCVVQPVGKRLQEEFPLEAGTCIPNPMPSGMSCWWGRAGCPERQDQFAHLPEPVCLITKVYAWQHLYYHLSRPESDRLMLLVKMFAKLSLLSVRRLG